MTKEFVLAIERWRPMKLLAMTLQTMFVAVSLWSFRDDFKGWYAKAEMVLFHQRYQDAYL